MDVEESITSVIPYPVLIDIRCKEYKDPGIKENAREKVAKHLISQVKMWGICSIFVMNSLVLYK